MGMSLARTLAQLPPKEAEEWIASLPENMVQEMSRGEWWFTARPEQIPPEGSWFVHLVLAGRGFGKTRAGAEWLVEQCVKHPYDRHGFPTEWLVIAEKTSDCRNICLEGPSGILRVLERRQIPHRAVRSPKARITLTDTGTKIHFEGADSPDVGRGYNAAGAWLDECVAEGEPVVTDRGSVPVESVQVGDRVLTRSGWRAVTDAWVAGHDRPVVRVVTDRGSVRVTPDHLVWTQGRGWVAAGNLAPGDTLAACQHQMDAKTRSPATPQPTMSGAGKPGSTISAPTTTTTAPAPCSTAASGPRSTGQSRMGTKSTTSTGGVGTTGSPTWSASLPGTIVSFLRKIARMLRGDSNKLRRRSVSGSANTGSAVSPGLLSAPSAGPPTTAPECAPSSARRSAEASTGSNALTSSVLTVEPAGTATVYDLTVDGEPEFFAGSGSLLVHNCAKWREPRRAWIEGIAPSMRADLTGDHPRVFVTTTPKPVDLIREWVERKDHTISIVTGSTFDNADNLSPAMLEEMRQRYEGTNIGRQELYGELLDLLEGSLFKWSDIEAGRVEMGPVNVMHRVVGVDPALVAAGDEAKDSNAPDEMGVIVASRDARNHVYIVADESVRLSGREAALHAWEMFGQYKCDVLVYESNLGKKWMEDVLTDTYNELRDRGVFPALSSPPMKPVHSLHGKVLRAEPVAVRYEQGTIHHIGKFEELENQMIYWDPLDSSRHKSPDRLDALVHAVRHLIGTEKRTARIHTPGSVNVSGRGSGIYTLDNRAGRSVY